MSHYFAERAEAMPEELNQPAGDTPAPCIDRAEGNVVTITLTGGTYRTYVMSYRVSNSVTSAVIAERQGLSLHDWLQTATAEELAFVGAGVVERVALWAAGVR